MEEVQTVDAENIDQNFAEMLEEPETSRTEHRKKKRSYWEPQGFLGLKKKVA